MSTCFNESWHYLLLWFRLNSEAKEWNENNQFHQPDNNSTASNMIFKSYKITNGPSFFIKKNNLSNSHLIN